MDTYIPSEEIVSFLVAGQFQCINSVLLDDFQAKIEQLKQNPDFSEQLKGCNKKAIAVAVQLLSDLGVISVQPYMDTKMISLSNPNEQEQIWVQENTQEKWNDYLSITKAYRTTEMDLNKSPKRKGI